MVAYQEQVGRAEHELISERLHRISSQYLSAFVIRLILSTEKNNLLFYIV